MGWQTKKAAGRIERAVRKASARHTTEAEELVRPVLQADERIVAMVSAMTGFRPSSRGGLGTAVAAQLSVTGWVLLVTDRRVFFLPFKKRHLREIKREIPRGQVRVLDWQVPDPPPSAVWEPGPVSFVLDVGGESQAYHLWATLLSDAEELIEALGGAPATVEEAPSAAPSPGAVAASGNPVCPSCRTVYNRSEVIRLLREQSPELFDFAVWATRFKCAKCGHEIEISGRQSE